MGGAQVTKTIGNKQKIWVTAVQARVTFTSAILAGMKSVKMLGLQDTMEGMLQKYRIDETSRMAAFRWSILWQNVVQNIPWALTPALTFAIYAGQALARGQDSLDTVEAFSSLAVIHLLTDPTAKLISAIPSTASTIGCFDRIQAFLLLKPKIDQRNLQIASSSASGISADGGIEMKTFAVASTESSSAVIQAEGISIRPEPEAAPILTNVNLSVAPGSLTVIVGPVAAGKSTLIKAFLGELPIEQGGTLTVAECRTSYCSQSPWLPNVTLKAAIIGPITEACPYDEAKYQKCLQLCDLDHDISLFEDGDLTELGSNGSALSGGQQHRIALARALYSRPKLLVLDDVFAALDWTTQRKVFLALFGDGGYLKKSKTTTILATSTGKHVSNSSIILPASNTVQPTF